MLLKTSSFRLSPCSRLRVRTAPRTEATRKFSYHVSLWLWLATLWLATLDCWFLSMAGQVSFRLRLRQRHSFHSSKLRLNMAYELMVYDSRFTIDWLIDCLIATPVYAGSGWGRGAFFSTSSGGNSNGRPWCCWCCATGACRLFLKFKPTSGTVSMALHDACHHLVHDESWAMIRFDDCYESKSKSRHLYVSYVMFM